VPGSGDTGSTFGFDETFRRTWHLYLSYCEGGFATGYYLDVHQLVLGRAET
jgi:cyclopropane-fatty-acyl-phospholipid synthase